MLCGFRSRGPSSCLRLRRLHRRPPDGLAGCVAWRPGPRWRCFPSSRYGHSRTHTGRCLLDGTFDSCPCTARVRVDGRWIARFQAMTRNRAPTGCLFARRRGVARRNAARGREVGERLRRRSFFPYRSARAAAKEITGGLSSVIVRHRTGRTLFE